MSTEIQSMYYSELTSFRSHLEKDIRRGIYSDYKVSLDNVHFWQQFYIQKTCFYDKNILNASFTLWNSTVLKKKIIYLSTVWSGYHTTTVWNSHIDEQLFLVIHEVKDLPTFITTLLHMLCNKAMRACINGIVSITMEIFLRILKVFTTFYVSNIINSL